MKSIKKLLRVRLFYYIIAIFISVILIINLGFYVYANAQYNIEVNRQSSSLEVMVSHLASEEENSVLLAYFEHYAHTANVQILYKNISEQVLFSNVDDNFSAQLHGVYYQNELKGYLAYDFAASTLGQEMTLGFIILNVSSVFLFLLGIFILKNYLFKLNDTLDNDFMHVGNIKHQFHILEVKRLNDALVKSMDLEKQTQKVYENHIRSLAHDVKTPLTVSMVYLEAIENNRIAYSSEINREITNELRKIESLIPRFIETDVMQLSYKHDVAEQIDSQVAKYQEVFQTKNINIQLELQPLEIDIANLDLQRIIENLVFNSFYYSNEGSVITVKTITEKKQIIVEDTGIGMSEETIVKILNGKYRDEQASTYNSKGSGIGYQIIREILSRIGGTILINSRIGVGTTVQIQLR